jgi:hypothetical protein
MFDAKLTANSVRFTWALSVAPTTPYGRRLH